MKLTPITLDEMHAKVRTVLGSSTVLGAAEMEKVWSVLNCMNADLTDMEANIGLWSALRKQYVNLFGWSLYDSPSVTKLITVLKESGIRRVVGVCSGLGFLERLLEASGEFIEVIATDSAPLRGAFMKIEPLDDVVAVQKYIRRDDSEDTALLASWLPEESTDCFIKKDDPRAHDYGTNLQHVPLDLRLYGNFFAQGGRTVVRVGEGHGGCTGSSSGAAYIQNKCKTPAEFIETPNFWEIYSFISIFECAARALFQSRRRLLFKLLTGYGNLAVCSRNMTDGQFVDRAESTSNA